MVLTENHTALDCPSEIMGIGGKTSVRCLKNSVSANPTSGNTQHQFSETEMVWGPFRSAGLRVSTSHALCFRVDAPPGWRTLLCGRRR